jgi:hypothetical protein
MKKYLVCLSIFCFVISCKENQTKKNSQTISSTYEEINFIEPKKIESFKKLEDFIKTSIYDVEEIDFTGDKIADFICKVKPNSKRQGIEYWISSDFKIIRQNIYYLDGFTHRRFANFDKDIEPEIFETEGDEDWIGYTLYDLDLKTGKRKVMLHFNPIINENNKNYWVTTDSKVSLKTRNNYGVIELLCSLNTPILNEEDEDLPMYQKSIPVIYFKGQHNSELIEQSIKKKEWLAFEKILEMTKK